MNIFRKIGGRIACLAGHHTRGKRDKEKSTPTERVYYCERCGSTWTRRNGKAKAA